MGCTIVAHSLAINPVQPPASADQLAVCLLESSVSALVFYMHCINLLVPTSLSHVRHLQSFLHSASLCGAALSLALTIAREFLCC